MNGGFHHLKDLLDHASIPSSLWLSGALLLLISVALVSGKEEGKNPELLSVPTPQGAVERMVELAEILPQDLVYDLGCGDGRIVVTAALLRGARAVGVDIAPEQVLASRKLAQEKGVENLVTIREGDIFDTDFGDADVVFLYLRPHLIKKLIPQLRQLKSGARIITFDFAMEGAKPELVERGAFGERAHCTIYKYTVPWVNDTGTIWDIFTTTP